MAMIYVDKRALKARNILGTESAAESAANLDEIILISEFKEVFWLSVEYF